MGIFDYIPEGKLPFWRTVGKAYLAPFRHPLMLKRVLLLWIVIMAVVQALYFVWLFADPNYILGLTGDTEAKRTEFTTGNDWLDAIASDLLYTALWLPMGASVAVAWHRLILRQETVRPFGYLRLDATVWIYVLVTLALAVLHTSLSTYLPAFLLIFNEQLGIPAEIVSAYAGIYTSLLGGIALTAVLYTLVGLIAVRLSIILPAVALNARDVTLPQVWRATRWNAWRLLFGTALCSAPIYLVLASAPATLFLGWLLNTPVPYDSLPFDPLVNQSVWLAAIWALSLVFIVVPIGFLSFAYQHFIEAGAAARAPTQSKQAMPGQAEAPS